MNHCSCSCCDSEVAVDAAQAEAESQRCAKSECERPSRCNRVDCAAPRPAVAACEKGQCVKREVKKK